MEYPGGGVQQLIGNMGPGARRDLDLGVIYTQGVIGGHDLPTLKKKKILCILFPLIYSINWGFLGG